MDGINLKGKGRITLPRSALFRFLSIKEWDILLCYFYDSIGLDRSNGCTVEANGNSMVSGDTLLKFSMRIDRGSIYLEDVSSGESANQRFT